MANQVTGTCIKDGKLVAYLTLDNKGEMYYQLYKPGGILEEIKTETNWQSVNEKGWVVTFHPQTEQDGPAPFFVGTILCTDTGMMPRSNPLSYWYQFGFVLTYGSSAGKLLYPGKEYAISLSVLPQAKK